MTPYEAEELVMNYYWGEKPPTSVNPKGLTWKFYSEFLTGAMYMFYTMDYEINCKKEESDKSNEP